MAPLACRDFGVAVSALATFGLFALPAAAQPYQGAIVTAPSAYWGYTYNPYVSPLHGVADIIRAKGDFLIKEGQAANIRETWRQRRIANLKNELDALDLLRDYRVNWFNRQREVERKADLDYILGRFPSTTELYTGRPQNVLLTELRKPLDLPADGSRRIDPDVLAKIDFNVDGSGNAGLIKHDKLTWPVLLRRPEFKAEREEIADRFARARDLAGQTQSLELEKAVRELRKALTDCAAHLRREFKKNADDPAWGNRYFCTAKNFLEQEMNQAILVLEKPEASFYLKPLEGKTAAELVRFMKDKGVRFAPATSGCERAYVILYEALVDEVNRLRKETPAARKGS
jgi:hypothetical protein